jgi:ribosomal-protein-alanine N-acetyltransferase
MYGQERVGFIALGGISYGPSRNAFIGYWIVEKFANQGLVTRAVCLVRDRAFNDLRLHRIEINIRPENQSSIQVAMKSGFELEGKRSKYLHIDGQWRDHLCFVATRD